MTKSLSTVPNPDLLVGSGNKQRWNQPEFRRHGFHNAHRIFRRSVSLRAPVQLVLSEDFDPMLAAHPAVAQLCGRPEISALVCARGDRVVFSHHADDFPTDQPHSIQSISKIFVHLIAAELIKDGKLDPNHHVEQYLPDIGTGYRGATIQALLDMDVSNDYSEDYTDPNASCFDEEVALGWRLPPGGTNQIKLRDFVTTIQSEDVVNHDKYVNYLSANTDVLTLVCDVLCPGALIDMTETLVAAAGLEHALHMSLSAEGVPTFSGGGCMSATDLARFGLMLFRQSSVLTGASLPNPDFTRETLQRPTKTLPPPRDYVRYSNHLMTNGRWIGHAGYGGQFLMVDMITGLSCAFLSVLENEAGYCIDYMAETIDLLDQIVRASEV